MTRQGTTPSKVAADAYFEQHIVPRATMEICQSLGPGNFSIDLAAVVKQRLREAWASLQLNQLPGPRALGLVVKDIMKSVQESVLLDVSRQEHYLTTILRVDEVREEDRQAMLELTGRSSVRGNPPPLPRATSMRTPGRDRNIFCAGVRR